MSTLARLFLMSVLVAGPAMSVETAQGYTPAEAESYAEMRALQEHLGSGKRAFVEKQLYLTPDEAGRFWPIYDAHQAALALLNKRRLDNIMTYARYWNADTLNDANANELASEAISIEKDEAALMESTFKKLKGVVPGVKAVRYLQVESKVRAIVRFEQAAQVPLAM